MLLVAELLLIAILLMILFVLRGEESALRKTRMPQGRLERYWDGSERRRHVRMDTVLNIKYQIEKNRPASGVTAHDISERGIRLLIDKKLERGTVIDMEILQNGTGKSIRIKGVVVWCNEAREQGKDVDKRLFHTGVKFIEVTRDSFAAFEELMCSLEEDLKVKSGADGNAAVS